MSEIFAIAFFVLSAMQPSFFSEHTAGISANTLYGKNVHYAVGLLGDGFLDRTKKSVFRVTLYSQQWKRVREKDVREYLGNQKASINIWMFGEKQTDYTPILREFKENAPHITVNIRTFSDEEEYYRLLEDRLASVGAPDIVLLSSGWVSDMNDVLEPLPQDIFSYSECQDFFFAFACDAFVDETEMMIAAPFFVDPLFMMANKRLLRDDRITLDDRPSPLWTGLLENGEKFDQYFEDASTHTNPVFVGFRLNEDSHILAKLFATLLLQGAEKETLTKESVLELLRYFDRLDDMAFDGKTKTQSSRKRSGLLVDQFLENELVIFFGTHSDYKQMIDLLIAGNGRVTESDVGLYPLPKVQKNDLGTVAGEAWAFALTKKAPNPGPATAFLAFLIEETSHEAYTQNNGKISTRVLIADRGVFREVAKNSQNPLGKTGSFDFHTEFPENLMAMFHGEMTPEEVADFVLSYLYSYDQQETKPEDK